MKPQALIIALLLATPLAQADSASDEAALYNETFTQRLNVGSDTINCLKARKVMDTPSGQRALEQLLPQLDSTGIITKQNSKAIVNVLRDQLPAMKKNGKQIGNAVEDFGNRASRQLTEPVQDNERPSCMNKGDSLLSGALRCGANAMIDNLQKQK